MLHEDKYNYNNNNDNNYNNYNNSNYNNYNNSYNVNQESLIKEENFLPNKQIIQNTYNREESFKLSNNIGLGSNTNTTNQANQANQTYQVNQTNQTNQTNQSNANQFYSKPQKVIDQNAMSKASNLVDEFFNDVKNVKTTEKAYNSNYNNFSNNSNSFSGNEVKVI